jgi:probable F420-dependent oxidoreductase
LSPRLRVGILGPEIDLAATMVEKIRRLRRCQGLENCVRLREERSTGCPLREGSHSRGAANATARRRGCRLAVEFGVVIPTWGAYGEPERIRRLIVRAEELGFASAWVGDHLFLPDYAIELSPANWYEALTCCLVGIGMTERIRFGTDVLVAPYRDPRLLAKIAATADRLSGGRLTLGMGVGFLEGEFHAMGTPEYAKRGAVTDEYLQVMRLLWETEGEVGHAGEFVSFPPAHFLPKPLQSPLPLWIGGNGKRGIRRAALLGDGWHPLFPSPSRYAEGRRAIEGLRGDRGLEGFTFSYSCPETRIVAASESTPRSTGYAGGEGQPDDYAYAPAPPSREDGRPFFIGTAAQLGDDIETLVDAGARHFVLRFWAGDGSVGIEDSLEQMERFVEDVMPRFDGQGRERGSA